MKSNKITIPKTAHYYTIGEIGEHIERLIIAFHGYGQAARKFVHKFEGLDDGKTLVVCPEGLSRFYWKNFTGDVVASWMTREDRDDDIKDNMNYINLLFESISAQLADNVEVSVLGFSQGCPTASRWVSSQQPDIHHLILWAGQLAHDENYAAASDYFKNKHLFFVYGTEDEFLPFGYKEKTLELAKKSGLEFDVKPFEGKHVVDREVLANLFKEIKSIKKLF